MPTTPQHKQRADQGLEFKQGDKSWSVNKVFKSERTNFREPIGTEELSDVADI